MSGRTGKAGTASYRHRKRRRGVGVGQGQAALFER